MHFLNIFQHQHDTNIFNLYVYFSVSCI